MAAYNTSEGLLSYLQKNPLLLAPMAGVTDFAFRSFMRKMGAGILTTELVSAIALTQEESDRTQKIAKLSPFQKPIGIQIFGETPEVLASAAIKVEKMGADFVDLNLGCPVPKIVKKGAGSALLKNLSLLSKILKSIKKAVKIPLTIKIRTGWDFQTRNALEVCHIAFNEGCLWTTIHGRTRSQGYSGQSDWSYIAEVKSQSKIPVIGNGDLTNPLQIQKAKIDSKCDGLMIGRGALKNPWIFQEASVLLSKGGSFINKNSQEVLQNLFCYLDDFYDERMALLQFKKFAVWFSSGRPESSVFRKNVFQLKEKAIVLEYIFDYFKNSQKKEVKHVPYEAFLMRGHG